MIGFVTTKKRVSTVLLILFLALVLLSLVLFKANQTASAEVLYKDAVDTKSRISFLKDMGYEVLGEDILIYHNVQ